MVTGHCLRCAARKANESPLAIHPGRLVRSYVEEAAAISPCLSVCLRNRVRVAEWERDDQRRRTCTLICRRDRCPTQASKKATSNYSRFPHRRVTTPSGSSSRSCRLNCAYPLDSENYSERSQGATDRNSRPRESWRLGDGSYQDCIRRVCVSKPRIEDSRNARNENLVRFIRLRMRIPKYHRISERENENVKVPGFIDTIVFATSAVCDTSGMMQKGIPESIIITK